jgi:hypothetical protein
VATRSSEIYKSRVDRTLFLYVEDGVPFQAVAEALDIVKANRLNRSGRLVTSSVLSLSGVPSFFKVVKQMAVG